MGAGSLFGDGGLKEVVIEAGSRILRALECLTKDSSDNVTANISAARVLAYQFGQPPAVGSDSTLLPRNMTAAPAVFEGQTGETETLDVQEQYHRCASSGWVANLGETAFQLQLITPDGNGASPFTVPSGASVQLPCMVKALKIIPSGGTAFYQAVLS